MTMLKYGTVPEDVRFELDDWAIVSPPEGTDGLDCVHACKDRCGVPILWSYAIPGDPRCPGCDARMPDEVQGLFALGNMDVKFRFNSRISEESGAVDENDVS